jgi:hypothetical protein
LKAESLGDKDALEPAVLLEETEYADMTEVGDEDGGVRGSLLGGQDEAYGMREE